MAGNGRHGWHLVLLRGVLLTAAALAIVLLLLWAPEWLVDFRGRGGELSPADRMHAVTEERRSILALLAAIGAAAGLYYTYLRHQLDRDSNRTDRYTKAVEQLGHASPDVQLGGVYALERIAFDSERDRGVISEVLSAFIREHARWNPDDDDADLSHGDEMDVPQGPTTVVRAALTVLGRRPSDDPTYPRADLDATDLAAVDLTGAKLKHARLSGARLTYADLSNADLTGADLTYADLTRVDLRGANLSNTVFVNANLAGATLYTADLTNADLSSADLTGANLAEANLTGAALFGANLADAYLGDANLTGADLSDAVALAPADFTGADLSRADLSRAKLARADLTRVSLVRADLTEADLTEADLTEANLSEANITEANLTAEQLRAVANPPG